MNQFILILIVSVLWINNHSWSVHAESKYLLKKPNCSEKHLEKIEIKIAKMMPIGPYARKLPENRRDVRFFCKESARLVRETEQFFKNCYRKEMLDLAKIIIFSIKQNIKLYCRRNTKRLDKLLKIAPCANKNIHTTEYCIGGFMNKTKQLIKFKNDKDKIKYACCNYVDGMRCAEEQIDGIVCYNGDHDKELILDTIRGVTGNFVNFACGDFDEASNQCDRLGPQKELADPVTKFYYTPVFLLVDLMESMESFQSI